MSNEKKKPTGWDADEVLQEMRDCDHAEDWPSDVSTLTRWADVFAALIAERDAAMDICRTLAKLRDGLDNSNSSAEYMAGRLSHKAHNLVDSSEFSHVES